METKSPVLRKNISELEVSDEFKAICSVNSFGTLDEIIAYQTDELLEKRGFNMHMLMELVEVAKLYDLGRLLKE